MKCLLINLDRSQDRLAHMTAEFARIGIDFERVTAVDAQGRPDLAETPMRLNPLTQLHLTNTEVACFLSHKACWARIAEGDDAFGAVFEDDVVFSENAGPMLADASWIPADAEIVKLETFFKKTRLAWRRSPAGHGFSTSRLHGAHVGAAGYILSRQTARDLIDGTAELGGPVDQVIFNPKFAPAPGKVIYQLVPALCAQERFLRTAGLPSLLLEERRDQWLAGVQSGSLTTKTLPMRIGAETRKLLGRIADLCLLKQRTKLIAFYRHGERVRPAHTHNREKAL
ncbi:glycosyltransferase family 25 protein [Mesorhizobium sp. AR07]|uniref:glycosyltransferase family 25 protein n=1 Tax=Mesorhizobium sp. AR07 TaxID=2865838 RepID=UPI00215E80F8|nr:glycosyltransferase family 25 protein [Mesorhizobium sp. AR07]UVK43372.1 glycosyltransferase family 25 protein [Mesorhizobium sp. AR07]